MGGGDAGECVRQRARDRDGALFEWLPQHFERMSAELEHLIEKQHAVMGQRDFAGARRLTAAQAVAANLQAELDRCKEENERLRQRLGLEEKFWTVTVEE